MKRRLKRLLKKLHFRALLLPTLLLSVLLGLSRLPGAGPENSGRADFVALEKYKLIGIGGLPGMTQSGENSDSQDSAEGEAAEQNLLIRVLLHTTDYGGLRHESVSVTSTDMFTVCKDGKTTSYETGAEFVPPDGGQADDVWRLEGTGGFSVREIKREHGCPIYKGSLIIYRIREGYAIVNELSLEDYVAGVLPGEVPSSFAEEAIRAQAVCARSYAFCHLGSYAYEDYSAHVDDSTNFQVYGNRAETELTQRAVRDTDGEILTYEGKPISTYFFSSSWGSTTDVSIWQENPADYPYLPAATLQPERRESNCAEEAMFRARMNDPDPLACDAEAPFYRWTIEAPVDAMSETINQYLLREGYDTIGMIRVLTVTKRGSGGVAVELRAEGTAGLAMLRGQGIIREALGSRLWEIQRKGFSSVTNWSMLPSAYFYIDERQNEAGEREIVLVGGGYGHGVGLSQHGANGLAGRGLSYREILQYFYPKSQIHQTGRHCFHDNINN